MTRNKTRNRFEGTITALLTFTLLVATTCGSDGVGAPEGETEPDVSVIDGSNADPSNTDLEAFPADLLMPEDPAPFVGAYAMTGTSPEGPVERTLSLNGNLEAMMSARWPESSPVTTVYSGIWKVSGAPDRPTAIVELNTVDGQAMDGADVITFELVAPGELVAIIYNLDRYGAEGLHFVRSD